MPSGVVSSTASLMRPAPRRRHGRPAARAPARRRVRHLVEGALESSDLVAAVHRGARVGVARRQPPGDGCDVLERPRHAAAQADRAPADERRRDAAAHERGDERRQRRVVVVVLALLRPLPQQRTVSAAACSRTTTTRPPCPRPSAIWARAASGSRRTSAMKSSKPTSCSTSCSLDAVDARALAVGGEVAADLGEHRGARLAALDRGRQEGVVAGQREAADAGLRQHREALELGHGGDGALGAATRARRRRRAGRGRRAGRRRWPRRRRRSRCPRPRRVASGPDASGAA